ncbi:hypothetical protein HXX76_010959 [Chlamydomonas incerta]|uniref:BTB domain-containing protein n=1 Tax=Chlamydomonas incerta TaxID=51695 RepID=A0A835VRY3_CHLIN|nr:hypothetical protein HXX76_010959 [Chlamydomonas incerta]|eukprot:KAG2423191.1 hypothetical protein HXX76_010959 [Chlamydomonas incerta]
MRNLASHVLAAASNGKPFADLGVNNASVVATAAAMRVEPQDLVAGFDAILARSKLARLRFHKRVRIEVLDDDTLEAAGLVTKELESLANSFVTLSFVDVPPAPSQLQPAQQSQQQSQELAQPGNSQQMQQSPQKQQQLIVDRAVLWHASPMLRGMFEDTCGGSGNSMGSGAGAGGGSGRGGCSPAVLVLPGDRAEDWEVALRLLQAGGEALELVTWDNVVPLCRLADKYDIARLRQDCAWFLSANAAQLTLTAPPTAPQNLLHAASLVERYLGQKRIQAAMLSALTTVITSAITY